MKYWNFWWFIFLAKNLHQEENLVFFKIFYCYTIKPSHNHHIKQRQMNYEIKLILLSRTSILDAISRDCTLGTDTLKAVLCGSTHNESITDARNFHFSAMMKNDFYFHIYVWHAKCIWFFVSHLPIKRFIFAAKKSWVRDFSAFRYNGDKLHFFVDHRSRCHFFRCNFYCNLCWVIAFFTLCWTIHLFPGRPTTWKKASLYAKLSFSCFMNILTNIHSHVHQHCQYFPFFYVECLPHAFLHSLTDSHLHFSTSSPYFFISRQLFCFRPPLLEPTREQRLFRWWLWFWFGQLCVILIFYVVNVSNSRS